MNTIRSLNLLVGTGTIINHLGDNPNHKMVTVWFIMAIIDVYVSLVTDIKKTDIKNTDISNKRK